MIDIKDTDFYIQKEKQLITEKNIIELELNNLINSLLQPIDVFIQNSEINNDYKILYSIPEKNIFTINFYFQNELFKIDIISENNNLDFIPKIKLDIENNEKLIKTNKILVMLEKIISLFKSNETEINKIYNELMIKYFKFQDLDSLLYNNKIEIEMSKNKNSILKLASIFEFGNEKNIKEFIDKKSSNEDLINSQFFNFSFNEESVTFSLCHMLIIPDIVKKENIYNCSKGTVNEEQAFSFIQKRLHYNGKLLRFNALNNLIDKNFVKINDKDITIKYSDINAAFNETFKKNNIQKF